MKQLIAIGASTGGPTALEIVLSGLEKTINVPILVLQHMPAPFTAGFAEQLNRMCKLEVSEARDREVIENNHVYIVPGGYHFFFEFPGPRVHLLHQDRGLTPSVDAGMISAVDHYGPGVIGIILSGMGHDGLVGARAIKQIGGTVIAESKESAAIYGMPREIIDHQLADHVLPAKDIARTISNLVIAHGKK
jgi:two-component system, chemotaxis family, protein-glutamate methylesterase/glutaminase